MGRKGNPYSHKSGCPNSLVGAIILNALNTVTASIINCNKGNPKRQLFLPVPVFARANYIFLLAPKSQENNPFF